MDYAKESLKKHAEWQGKIEMVTRCKLDDKEDLSILENLTTETITQIVNDYAIFNGFRQPETEKK